MRFTSNTGTSPGTLQRMTTRENKFPNLVGPGGAWTTRNDVRYRGVVSDFGDGPLRADVAGGSFGPELDFGYVMGGYHDEPVLLIKSCIGNRSLMWDFAAPTTPSFDYADDGTTYAGYGQGPNSWLTATGAPSPFVWYASKQFDDCFKKESDMSQLTWQIGISYQANGNVGSQVRHNGVEYQCKATHTSSAATEPRVGADWATVWRTYSITNVADVLDGLDTGIEWVGGGNPAIGSDDAGLAPTLDRTHPEGKLRFIFRRTTAAKNDANTTIAAQYGGNLAGWTNAVHQGTAANQITITETASGPGLETVTIALPANLAGSGKLFVRRNVAIAE